MPKLVGFITMALTAGVTASPLHVIPSPQGQASGIRVVVKEKPPYWHCPELEADLRSFSARIELGWAFVRRARSNAMTGGLPAESVASVVVRQCPLITNPPSTGRPCETGVSFEAGQSSGIRAADADAFEAVVRGVGSAPLRRCASGAVALEVRIDLSVAALEPVAAAMAVLGAEDNDLRLQAVWMVGELAAETPRGRAALEAALADSDETVRRAAKRALGQKHP